jgi:hypothetical protein
MKRLAAILLFGVALSAGTRARADEDSLYDGQSVTMPDESILHFLGPKAKGIRYDARMIRAAEIAMNRAYPHPTWRCWRYVKDALLEARVIHSRPTSPWAKEAGEELCERYGFVRLKSVRNPMEAPVGAVIVYGGADAGHVEIRTATGFVSDFISSTPYPRPFLGAYIKPA